MSEERRHPGPKVVFVFALLGLVFMAILLIAFWKGPRGKFTETELARPIDAPALVRTFCIDPAKGGPKSLDEWPHCANADRLEFTLSPIQGKTPFAAWVLVGSQAIGVVAHGPLADAWSAPIPLKGLPPGSYGLVYVFSDRAFTEAELRTALESVPGGNIARLQALEGWAQTRQKAGEDVKLVRLPFQIEQAQQG